MARRMQDELRRTFIFYAAFPLVVIIALSFALFYFYWSGHITRRSEDALDAASEVMETSLKSGMESSREMSENLNITRLKNDAVYYVEFYRRLHLELDRLHVYKMFVVLDAERRVVMESRTTSYELPDLSPDDALWPLTNMLDRDPMHAAYMFTSRETLFGQPQDAAVGSAIVEGGVVEGYIIFVASGNEMLRELVHPRVNFVVEIADGSTPLCTDYNFSQKLSNRLRPDFREANGLVMHGGSDYYVRHRKISFDASAPLTVYAITPLGELRSYLFQVVFIFAFAIIILLSFLVFLSRRQSEYEMRNLKKIAVAFAAVEQGDLAHRLEIESPEELKIVAEAYNSMVDSLKRLVKSNEEKTRAAVTLEVSQLTSQFDPHFLYNTLSSIKFMIAMSPEAAGEMTMALSRLLRYSIRQATDAVTVGDDIEHLYDYMEIMQYRFGERFDYTVNMEDDTESALVPKLILQPIIENSLKYGLERVPHIYVAVSVQKDETNGTLRLSVSDTGGGMDDEMLVAVRESIDSNTPPKGHAGLYNVHRRIKLLYGEGYGLTITSSDGKGTTVVLRMPLTRKSEQESDE